MAEGGREKRPTFRATQTLFRFISRSVAESYCADSNISIVLLRLRPPLRRSRPVPCRSPFSLPRYSSDRPPFCQSTSYPSFSPGNVGLDGSTRCFMGLVYDTGMSFVDRVLFLFVEHLFDLSWLLSEGSLRLLLED